MWSGLAGQPEWRSLRCDLYLGQHVTGTAALPLQLELETWGHPQSQGAIKAQMLAPTTLCPADTGLDPYPEETALHCCLSTVQAMPRPLSDTTPSLDVQQLIRVLSPQWRKHFWTQKRRGPGANHQLGQGGGQQRRQK